ncbi:uncharacterized protein LOC128956913 [Oppia nitens]|uniref:uncharacterized protein LOC128956913 n=1 Tax=Oppia nitens TaxID=1686743 RepID=UPI0023D9AA02|nr:uncharacterized protein LOC128956913 [Oppia nitens]
MVVSFGLPLVSLRLPLHLLLLYSSLLLLLLLSSTVGCFQLKLIETLLPVDGQCWSLVSTESANCYQKYLSRFDGIRSEEYDSLPQHESEQYKQHVCCNIWRYCDCLAEAVAADCPPTAGDQRRIGDYVRRQDNPLAIYCSDFPYHTYRCWRFPLWAIVLVAIVAVVVLIGVGIGVWFWRQKRITYWRFRRKY